MAILLVLVPWLSSLGLRRPALAFLFYSIVSNSHFEAALRDQVFANHVEQRFSFDIFGVAAGEHSFGAEVRRPTELGYPLRDLIGMSLFLIGVFKKFLRNGLRVPFAMQ